MRYNQFFHSALIVFGLVFCTAFSAIEAQTNVTADSYTSLIDKGDSRAVYLDKGISLGQALKKLEEEFSMTFQYPSGILGKMKISRQYEVRDNIEQVLKELLAEHSLNFQAVSSDRYRIYSINQELRANSVQPENVVTGTVTDASTDEVLPGVNVTIKGTTQGTTTNVDGEFELEVSSLEQDTLQFSFVGFETLEVPVEGRTELDVAIPPEAIEGEEVIVTGYRTQTRGSVTGSVSSVNSEDFQDIPAGNLSNALSGRLSGATISQNAGTPGRESSISIRAIGTFNNASPLFVIDGVVSDKAAFDGLSSNEVESVTILKDGAAASVYGSRAANGVVLVTTKRGSEGAPRFSYNGSAGIQTPTRIPSSINAWEHATLINDALDYINAPADDPRYYSEDELDYYRENSWNWVEELWRDPVDTQHSLDVSGGTDNVRYFLSGSYNYALGSFNNLDYDRYNLRGNMDVDVTENLTASLDLSTERRGMDGPSWGGNDWAHRDLYKALVLRSPMVPPYVNGEPTGNYVEWHPGAVINRDAGYTRRERSSLNYQIKLNYEVPFVEGLNAALTFNNYQRDDYRRQFNLPYEMTVFNQTGDNDHIIGDEPVDIRPRISDDFLATRSDKRQNYQLNANLNYQRSFGDHNLDALFVYEQTEEDYEWFEGRRDEFISRNIDQYIAGSGAPEDSRVNGGMSEGARLSYVGILSYDYDETYMLEGSFRYDGSVIFAPENRWGFFPSVSAGWQISNEPFFNVDFFDDLKVRASVGLLGNDDVGSFQWLQSYDIQQGAIFDSPSSGLQPGNLVNRDITWEKSLSYNSGVDATFLENRFDLKLDLFYRHTYDILGSRQTSLPSTFGASLPDENYQEIDSRGFELELGYNNNFGSTGSPLNFQVRGNFGYATNEVLKLDEAENIRDYQSEIGYPTGRIFGYIATDIIRTQEDLDALPEGYTILGEEPRLGMLNYQDLRGPNSDEPDGRITSDDQDYIASHSTPPINYGMTVGGSWKSLSVTALFQGVAGHKTMLPTSARRVQGRQEEASYGFWADRWTPDNTDGDYPAARRVGWPPTDYPPSTWFMRDASFVRLKNLNISYDLPQETVGRLGIDRLRVFFNGQNLFLLYDNLGDWDFDPEVVLPDGNGNLGNIQSYPLMRTLSLGLNIDL